MDELQRKITQLEFDILTENAYIKHLQTLFAKNKESTWIITFAMAASFVGGYLFVRSKNKLKLGYTLLTNVMHLNRIYHWLI